MGCHFLLQGIFPTQRSNPGLLHCRQILYHLSHEGSPFTALRSVTQSCPTLCDPMGCSTLDLPVHHQFPELSQTHVHRVGDAIQFIALVWVKCIYYYKKKSPRLNSRWIFPIDWTGGFFADQRGESLSFGQFIRPTVAPYCRH